MSMLFFAAILLLVTTMAGDSAPDSKRAEYCKRTNVEATIIPNRQVYGRHDEVTVEVRIDNRSTGTIFVLKQGTSGGTWVDRNEKRIVFAHSAYTKAREDEAGVGVIMRGGFRPEFFRLEAGRDLLLITDFGQELESGEWRLEGTISYFDNIPSYLNKSGFSSNDELAKYDCVVQCKRAQITILESDGSKGLPTSERGTTVPSWDAF